MRVTEEANVRSIAFPSEGASLSVVELEKLSLTTPLAIRADKGALPPIAFMDLALRRA